MAVPGLLLAAGAGRRYGMPKALAPTPDEPGVLLVEHGVRTLRKAGCAPVVAVLGAQARRVPPLPGVIVVVNADWASGMGSSLRAGLAALEADAVVVLLVDTPGITPEAVSRVAEGAGRGTLRVATYGGAWGHPVVLGRDHWEGVSELAVGDVGARPYLKRHAPEPVPCDDVADGTDLDVPRA
ncbi:nucleotidyltransferase family protein [Actinocorallia sp. API 0066]|uniref:nucleotidyltransferase family protein n=1 Tax=Actinocorallia sp. API 0066 TaxID=2896846 RepID=UPI001E2ABA3E|nr:nucleotidyltransferase family protein [Actinocorallia sp. API 0066]MCD0451505.1 nucleotidyltransferase family protein [Actinocorallia sp. API 0066]